MNRIVLGILLAAVTIGSLALVSPAPAVQAAQCIVCPQIYIECGSCYQLVPQSCKRCAYCKRIPGCQS